MTTKRIYLDFNATAPLSQPCKTAMAEAMNFFGNASSIHTEGRKVRSLIESARDQICIALEVQPENIVITSGATEGAALLLKERNIICAKVEHSCVGAWCEQSLEVSKEGLIKFNNLTKNSVQLANSETGILQDLPKGLYMSDIVQAVGKINVSFSQLGAKSAVISAHKFGGPQGIGAVLTEQNFDIKPQIIGGGQEKGYRSGTENFVSIVGFGAAIEFAKMQLDDGVWDKVEELRNFLEDELANVSPSTIFIGKDQPRLPNTSCFVTPGWRGAIQVMQMDLAGFSISAGSACSSGRTTKNNNLGVMGYDPELAECAVRISIGTETTKSDLESFIKAWAKIRTGQCMRVA